MKSYEEFEKYVKEMNENIAKKLEDSEEEFAFYEYLVESFSSACEKKVKLEQALDEIKEYVVENSQYWDETGLRYWKEDKDEAHDILDIIKKAKEK